MFALSRTANLLPVQFTDSAHTSAFKEYSGNEPWFWKVAHVVMKVMKLQWLSLIMPVKVKYDSELSFVVVVECYYYKDHPHLLAANTHCKSIARQKPFWELLLKQYSKMHLFVVNYQTVRFLINDTSRNSTSTIQQGKVWFGMVSGFVSFLFRFILYHRFHSRFYSLSGLPHFYLPITFTMTYRSEWAVLMWTQMQG